MGRRHRAQRLHQDDKNDDSTNRVPPERIQRSAQKQLEQQADWQRERDASEAIEEMMRLPVHATTSREQRAAEREPRVAGAALQTEREAARAADVAARKGRVRVVPVRPEGVQMSKAAQAENSDEGSQMSETGMTARRRRSPRGAYRSNCPMTARLFAEAAEMAPSPTCRASQTRGRRRAASRFKMTTGVTPANQQRRKK